MKRIDSSKNDQIKKWKKFHTKKYRDASGRFLIEGYHLVEEALKYEGLVEELIWADGAELRAGWNDIVREVYVLSKDAMRAISQTEAPQGVAAVCKMPFENIVIESGKNYLLVDRVQDPGNLGTMIRTAEAAGMDAVILNKGTVDPFNEKIVRSTQGALFHMPVVTMDFAKVMDDCEAVGIPVYGTALYEAQEYKQVKLPRGSFALMVGNEGSGIDPEWLQLTHQNLYVPIHGKSESLNVAVATAILLYYLKNI